MSELTPFVERVVPARQPAATPPLLVLLHGIGADEHDLLPLADTVDPRFVVASLRAPHPYFGGYAWFPIDVRPGGRVVPDLGSARTALAGLIQWLTAAPARLATDPAQTFLLGFSQGAMMSLAALHRVPERLAGVVALSGRVPEPLIENGSPPGAIAQVPVFVGHGTLDNVVPISSGRRARDLLHPLVRDFTYQEFDVGHGIGHGELATVTAWLTTRLASR